MDTTNETTGATGATLLIHPHFCKIQRDGATIARIHPLIGGKWARVGYPHNGGPAVAYAEVTEADARRWLASVAMVEALS